MKPELHELERLTQIFGGEELASIHRQAEAEGSVKGVFKGIARTFRDAGNTLLGRD